MADSARVEELRRRVERDPASIAFAQLAEEYRRAGRVREAIETCETGLARHPGYLSARVTLGRALLETGQLEPAQEELKRVLRTAPENLAALRGLAEIHHRRGELQEALAHYRTALEFARHDPELEQVIAEISAELEPSRGPQVVDGLSFEEAAKELLAFSGNGDEPVAGDAPPGAEALSVDDTPGTGVTTGEPVDEAVPECLSLGPLPALEDAFPELVPGPAPAIADTGEKLPAEEGRTRPDVPAEEADRQIAALERWLEAIVAERERRSTPSA